MGRSTLLRLLALAVVALGLLHNARSAYDVLGGLVAAEPGPRAPFSLGGQGRLDRLTAAAERAGLREGDRLREAGGRVYGGPATLYDALRGRRPGEAFPVTVERDGRTITASPILASERDEEPGDRRGNLLLGVLLAAVMPLFNTLLGGWTVLVRPTDRRAWLLLGLLLGFSQLATVEIASWEPGLREFGVFWRQFWSTSWAAFMLLFGLEFPTPFAWDRRRPWIKAVPVAVLFGVGILGGATRAAALTREAAIAPLPPWISAPVLALTILGISSFFACLGVKTARTDSPDARRRLQILRWGATAALTPLFLVMLAAGFRTGSLRAFPDAVIVPALLALLLFPATLAYVIVVERALDVRLALRMGARYLLVKNGLRLLIFAVMLPVASGAVWALLRSGWPVPVRFAVGAAFVVLVVLVRRRVVHAKQAIDRKFFREVYDEEQILTGVGEKIRTIVDEGELLGTVVRALDASLHVHPITVLRDGEIPGGKLHDALLAADGPLGVYVDDPASWTAKPGALSDAERGLLRGLQAQVILPLEARDRLLGAIVLGPKRSEQPFTGTDMRLLRNLTAQVGLALDNSRLTAAVAAESAQRARVERELEIARQVQEGLFPREAPSVPGLQLAGHCRPAAGIGGDYYDYLDLADGRIGIACGDVSGKGIPAALLMAGLQASLRGQRLHGGDLTQLMARINRLVYDATPSNRYATFFYGEYDPATGDLHYVNAGHNPPVLLRADPRAEPVLLKAGGMVVGLLPEATFTPGRVRLEPGDVLVAYTDGVSEAMNPADEEWGMERLVACARQAGAAPAPELLERVMAAATAFAGTAPQHDDMTLVVLRRGVGVPAEPAPAG